MADKNLSLALRVSADVSPILAGLKKLDDQYGKTMQSLKSQSGKIGLLTEAEKQADTLAKGLDEAKRKLEFFRRSAEIGGASGLKEFAKDIKAAEKEVTGAERAFNRQQAAIAKMRQELSAAGIDTKNLAAEQVRLAAQLKATESAQAKNRLKAGTTAVPGADTAAAANLLGLQSHAGIEAQINKLRAAYDTLRASGTLSHRELAQAAGVTRERIAALNEQMNGHQAVSSRLSGAYGVLRAGFYAFQAALAGNAIVKAVDDMTLLEARVKLVSASQGQAATAMQGIAAIAKSASAPIDQVGASYVRFANSVRNLGGTQQQSLQLTEAVALGLRVSGSSAQEAGSAMYQLGQAFSKGKLSGDEFVTMSEAGGKLMDYLAQGLGKTRGELIAMSSAGELTADKMLGAWQKMLPQIRKDAQSLPPTVGAAMQDLSNSFKTFAADSDTLRVGMQALAGTVRFLGDHLGAIAGVAMIAGVAALAANWAKVTVAIRGAAVAARLLVAANPILLGISLLATGAVLAYDALADSAETAGATQVEAAAKAKEAQAELEDRLKNLVQRRATLEKQSLENAKAAIKDELDARKKAINEEIGDAERLRDDLISAYRAAGQASQDALNKAAALRAKFAKEDRPDASTLSRRAIIERDAMTRLDVIAGQQKLDRLASSGADIQTIERQAELVKTTAEGLYDQAKAKEMVRTAEEALARAYDKAAASESAIQTGLADQMQANDARRATLKTDLAEIEAKLKAIASEKTDITIAADADALAKVNADIAGVKASLAELARGVTIPIRTEGGVNTGGATGKYATGGPIVGPGGPTADQVLMWGSNGEHMIPAAEVQAAGGQAAIYRLRAAIRAGLLPHFANGGAVLSAANRLPSLAGAGATAAPNFPHLGRIDLGLAGNTYPVYAEPDVASAIRVAALKRGGR